MSAHAGFVSATVQQWRQEWKDVVTIIAILVIVITTAVITTMCVACEKL